jgi:predicted MFS family arabinose efflux permease
VIAAIAMAGLLWLLAALLFSRLSEDDSSPGDPKKMRFYWQLLRDDSNLRRFILVRGLLVSMALAPPFLVMLAQGAEQLTGQLGLFLAASSAAGFCSAYIWGRLSDWSSRLMLCLTGCLGAAALVVAIFAYYAGLSGTVWVIPVILFVLMVAYQGVRQARSTYLVDISPEDRRSANAAVANTSIGVILLLAGVLGGALSWVGPVGAPAGYAAMSLAGGIAALSLRDVSDVTRG